MTNRNEISMLKVTGEERKVLDAFKLGEGVTVTTGPLQGIYGIIVFYDQQQKRYLVRFTGQQQLYFSPEEIILWSKK